VKYNLRVWEMKCANVNGKSAEEWYWIAVQDRTWKVASMVIPSVISTLEAIEMKANRR
jgi:hypothetical protein